MIFLVTSANIGQASKPIPEGANAAHIPPAMIEAPILAIVEPVDFVSKTGILIAFGISGASKGPAHDGDDAITCP